jgi:acetyl-CoA carboxylase carboxyltransferase component
MFAPEVITAFARIDGRPVGIVASQPKHKGGVLFVDSADKAARFIWLCDAFGIPLLYLADVPGFMIGTKVEREGIIRAGAKMIMAVSEATVPKLCVVVRKAYGAGLYAFCGPAFEPDATIALPQAMIAVMGPEAAVNAVYFNKIQEKPEGERADYVKTLRDEYRADIDIEKLASEQVIDAIVPGDRLRAEIAARLLTAAQRGRPRAPKRRSVTPV